MAGPPDKTVGELMQGNVVTLDRNDELSVADDLMSQGRIRHLPVLDEDGELAGVVSQRDLFRGALSRALGYGSVGERKVMESLVVKEVMATEVITATPEMRLADAATLMLEHKVGCLPVVSEGKLVGLLTETDLVGLIAAG